MPKQMRGQITLTEDEARALSAFISRYRARSEEVAFDGHLTVEKLKNWRRSCSSRRSILAV